MASRKNELELGFCVRTVFLSLVRYDYYDGNN